MRLEMMESLSPTARFSVTKTRNMLNVQKVVIHELLKEARSNEASTYISQNLLEITEDIRELASKLEESYSKDVITYAVFNNETGRLFPSEFARYHASVKSDTEFMQFTTRTLNQLRDQIRNVNLAKGGFFVFAQYENRGTVFLSVYLIRDSDGVLFKKDPSTHSFEVDRIKYMNTEKLAMGCRINFAKYATGDGSYLSLIKNKQIDISEYFNNWIAIQQAESSTEFTNTLYNIINNIEPPSNDDGTLTIDNFRKAVVEYINTQPSKIVNLKQLGLHFYDDEQKFIDYANENNLTIDHEFRTNSKALKKFVRIEINADGINLKFTRGEFLRKIKISEHNRNQVIIESERFANSLRSEMNNS
jgi:nucleoid-associated protein